MSGPYRILRSYRNTDDPDHNRVVKRGLSEADAQAYCRNPKTRATDSNGVVIWWCVYTDGRGTK